VAERIRIEIGFDGGQIMGAVVDGESVDRLESALDVEDGRYTVALSRIVYVKRFSREGRVGFGA
jgi:hypothetical protein